MIVQSLMSSPVVTAGPADPARRLASLMRERRIGSVVITDDDGRPLGVVTERDLVARVVAEGLDAEATPARAIMSKPPVSIEPHAHLDEAVALMEQEGIHHLLVVLDGEMRGLLSSTDVAAAQPDLQRRLRGALGTRWED